MAARSKLDHNSRWGFCRSVAGDIAKNMSLHVDRQRAFLHVCSDASYRVDSGGRQSPAIQEEIIKFHFLFESDANGDYVGVLSEPTVFGGLIAAQDAGSVNSGIYYQVGGGAVNGHFYDALGGTKTAGPLNDAVNSALQSAYDARFGQGAWKKDQNSAAPPLTSFYIPLPNGVSQKSKKIGKSVVGMVYSVGPAISDPDNVDSDQYIGIYGDGLKGLTDANQGAASGATIEGLRLTMVSAGLYANMDEDAKVKLRQKLAGLILDAIEDAAKGPGAAQLPTTFLINCGPDGYEMDAYTVAAKARKIDVTSSGFDWDVDTTSARGSQKARAALA